MSPWFLLFFVTPIAEMYLLLTVGGQIGALPTVALVMLTAVIGVYLLRRQGLETLTRGVGRMNQGELPGGEIAEGLLLAIAGALLLTPGFITDTVGFVLLTPPLRAGIATALLARVHVQGHMGPMSQSGQTDQSNPQPDHGHPPPQDSGVIEGEFKRH